MVKNQKIFAIFFWFFFFAVRVFSLPEAVGVRLSPECEDWRIFCDGDKSEDFAIFF